MPQYLEINSGVIVKQQQQGTPFILPNESVTMPQLQSTVRSVLRTTDFVVGSASDVTNKYADYSSLASAIAALTSGGKILVRNSYTGAENITLSGNNIHIEGMGHLTVIGTVSITGDFNSICNLKHGNLTLAVGADHNWVRGTWTAGTVTDSGTDNETQYVAE